VQKITNLQLLKTAGADKILSKDFLRKTFPGGHLSLFPVRLRAKAEKLKISTNN